MVTETDKVLLSKQLLEMFYWGLEGGGGVCRFAIPPTSLPCNYFFSLLSFQNSRWGQHVFVYALIYTVLVLFVPYTEYMVLEEL